MTKAQKKNDSNELEKRHSSLCKERQPLVLKSFTDGLSEEEDLKLKKIEAELDKIDEARLAADFALWDDLIETLEIVGEELSSLADKAVKKRRRRVHTEVKET